MHMLHGIIIIIITAITIAIIIWIQVLYVRKIFANSSIYEKKNYTCKWGSLYPIGASPSN